MNMKRKVHYEYRCRRCRDIFPVGDLIDEQTASRTLQRVTDYDEGLQDSTMHICRDGGKGFADLVGLSPLYLGAIEAEVRTIR